jgi:hypothetical protein
MTRGEFQGSMKAAPTAGPHGLRVGAAFMLPWCRALGNFIVILHFSVDLFVSILYKG